LNCLMNLISSRMGVAFDNDVILLH